MLDKIFIFSLVVISFSCASIIKSGSVLSINVVDHEEFSGKYTVSPSGTIDYPLIADEVVANMTTSDLMNELTYRLAKHIENPLVLISIIERPEIRVAVLGEVNKPGPVKIYKEATLQEVIAMAEGFKKSANLEDIRVVSGNRIGNNVVHFNMKEFVKDGDISKMPRLVDGDAIVVLAKGSSKDVKILGAVKNPGKFEVDDSLTIFELIYLAGGPAQKADLSRVRRLYSNNGKSVQEIINLQKYIDNGNMDEIPKVQPGDIIIVYSRWFDWKVLMNILSNVLLFIVTIQSIKNAVSN